MVLQSTWYQISYYKFPNVITFKMTCTNKPNQRQKYSILQAVSCFWNYMSEAWLVDDRRVRYSRALCAGQCSTKPYVLQFHRLNYVLLSWETYQCPKRLKLGEMCAAHLSGQNIQKHRVLTGTLDTPLFTVFYKQMLVIVRMEIFWHIPWL